MASDHLTWHEVLAVHGSRRGIRVTPTQASVLLDFGLSPYTNRREGPHLFYEGEGKRGDQQATCGNADLLECLASARPVRVFERSRPGVWHDRGWHRVSGVEYKRVPEQGRSVFEFCLEPQAGEL